ncbi:Hypothetical protein NTJ_15372 [Nesidiocoris tenuis]|uniref:Uncharacterized protein n=1 Tax=Nesidiocoris tenuis TaxID=355587 RepID=A0ABN7BDU9_9HEMI|nr:Hypothetical protein NTJ_15372 [Nesidiocoris tenuis]
MLLHSQKQKVRELWKILEKIDWNFLPESDDELAKETVIEAVQTQLPDWSLDRSRLRCATAGPTPGPVRPHVKPTSPRTVTTQPHKLVPGPEQTHPRGYSSARLLIRAATHPRGYSSARLLIRAATHLQGYHPRDY